MCSSDLVKQVADDLYNGVTYGEFDSLKVAENRLVEILNTLANTLTVGEMLDVLNQSDDESSDEG